MKLKKMTFALSLIGILLLLFLAVSLPPRKIVISKINPSLLNKQIKTSGQIIKIRTYNISPQKILQILEIKDLDSMANIEVILNNPQTDLEKNQNITVTGKINQYKDSLQIQADKVYTRISQSSEIKD